MTTAMDKGKAAAPAPAPVLCACGCGRRVKPTKDGRERKFASVACKNRQLQRRWRKKAAEAIKKVRKIEEGAKRNG